MSCYGTVGVYSQIAFLIVWPIVAICLTPLIGLLLALLFKHTTALELRALGWRRGDRGLIDAVLLGYAVPLTLLILFFAFPPVTSLAFRLFEECTTFSDELGESQAFLISSRKHYAVACPSDELADAQSLAWVAILLYPVGVVVFSAWLLYLGRARLLLKEQDTPYTRSIAFLHAPFVPSYFYFDLLELCKKLLLIGFASLIEPGSIMQIMIAVLVSLLFLVLHLQSLPYRRHLDNMLATTIHLGLCVFFIWCLLLQTGALATEENSSKLSDTGTAISIMMLISLVGVLVVAVLLFLMELAARAATERAESRQRDKWAGCTIEPPTVKWPSEKSYACFLSHYKMEAASDARLLHDMLAKMLRYPVFLDSANLTDLRQLISNGVADSDVMLMLGTKGLFTRPWCLLEVVHSARLKVPTIIVEIRNSGFDAKESQRYIDNLEETMGTDDPSSLELLHEHLGQDLTELKAACAAVLTSLIENGKRLSCAGSTNFGSFRTASAPVAASPWRSQQAARCKIRRRTRRCPPSWDMPARQGCAATRHDKTGPRTRLHILPSLAAAWPRPAARPAATRPPCGPRPVPCWCRLGPRRQNLSYRPWAPRFQSEWHNPPTRWRRTPSPPKDFT